MTELTEREKRLREVVDEVIEKYSIWAIIEYLWNREKEEQKEHLQ